MELTPKEAENMKESPNHMKPVNHPVKTSDKADAGKMENNMPVPDPEEPVPGQPVLGSDHGPWKGSDES